MRSTLVLLTILSVFPIGCSLEVDDHAHVFLSTITVLESTNTIWESTNIHFLVIATSSRYTTMCSQMVSPPMPLLSASIPQ